MFSVHESSDFRDADRRDTFFNTFILDPFTGIIFGWLRHFPTTFMLDLMFGCWPPPTYYLAPYYLKFFRNSFQQKHEDTPAHTTLVREMRDCMYDFYF